MSSRPAVSGHLRSVVVAVALCVGVFGALTTGHFGIAVAAAASIAVMALIWRRPATTVDLVIIVTFTTLPASVPDGVRVGGLYLYFHEFAVAAAVVYAGFRLRELGDVGRRMARSPIAITLGVFLVVLGLALAHGLIVGYPVRDVQYDLRPVFALVGAAFVFAVLAVRKDLSRHVPSLLFALSFSAFLMIVSSATGYELAGREEVAQLYTTTGRLVAGGSDAHRILTATTPAALAVTLVCVALLLLGAGNTKSIIALLIPALVVDFFSFSRNAILGVAVMIAFLLVMAVLNRTLRDFAVRLSAAVVALAVALGVAFVGLSGVGANQWVEDQVAGYSNRVFSGLEESTRAVDSSTQNRELENRYLASSAEKSEIFGNGLGFRYKPPVGPPDEFAADQGQLYAHNYYGWLWAKAGLVGLAAFLGLLAACLVPVIIRKWRDAQSIAVASATAGLAAVISVSPMPNDHGGSIVFGCLVGYAIARSVRGPTGREPDGSLAPAECRAGVLR